MIGVGPANSVVAICHPSDKPVYRVPVVNISDSSGVTAAMFTAITGVTTSIAATASASTPLDTSLRKRQLQDWTSSCQ